MSSPTPSQLYLSTRGGSYGFSFEEVVLKGLASDGGLFIPEEIPSLPEEWATAWKDLSFADLAHRVLSLYVSPSEIPSDDLKDILRRSYSTFRTPDVTPLVTLDPRQNLHLLELFHGPTFAFKDVALQFLGNLFEYFLVRRNEGKTGHDRHHLTVVGATSGDTGSAAIYGLRGKKDVSVFILHPEGRVSPVQAAQMTTVLDPNVHNLAVEGTFDDCQDMVKALFADPSTNATHRLAAVNSINWARILAQITYYFHAYFALAKLPSWSSDSVVRFVVPTGNFGDVLAGYFAQRMGLPIDKLIVATNENDILYRFWTSGSYEKKALHGPAAVGGFATDGARAHEDGVKETLAPAMDILASSNFERLLWYLAYDVHGADGPDVDSKREMAGAQVRNWLGALKSAGGFDVGDATLHAARVKFEAERVDDAQTLATIKVAYKNLHVIPASSSSPSAISAHAQSLAVTATSTPGYVLDPHSAIGVAAALRSVARSPLPRTHHVALATAHPAKFASAVQMALSGEDSFDFDARVLPAEFVGLEAKERRLRILPRGVQVADMKRVLDEELEKEGRAA